MPFKGDFVVRDDESKITGIITTDIDLEGDVGVLWDALGEIHYYRIEELKESFHCLPLLSISDMLFLLNAHNIKIQITNSSLQSDLFLKLLWDEFKINLYNFI